METQRIKISELSCDPANVRAHDSKNLDAIKASLQRFGQQKPIVVDEKGVVIAGNGTLTAARALGWDAINIVRTELAGAEATAYAIADNRTAELAEWDDEALAKQLSALQIEDEALVEAAGFTDAELTALVDEVTGITEGNTDPDEVPEVPEEPTAQPGQIWQLGDHRLMCGDSTSADDVAALMDGEKADLCFTSPPYNAGSMNIDGNKSTQSKYDLFEDDMSGDDYFSFVLTNVKIMLGVAEEVFYNIGLVQGNKVEIFKLVSSMEKSFKDVIYWRKSTAAPHIQPGVINNLVEFILCFGDGKRAFRNPQFNQGSYWNVIEGNNASGNEYADVHKATFPVYLPSNIVSNFTPPSGSVIDCFAGTGTTLIACEQTGRKCYGMELSPAYCDVIIKRWEDFTGQTAELLNG